VWFILISLGRCARRETTSDVNNRNLLRSDRGRSHVVNHNDSGIEQPDGERTDGTNPNLATSSVRDALRGSTRTDY